MSTKRLAESVDGLDSSLARMPGELFIGLQSSAKKGVNLGLGMPKIEFRILEIWNLVGTVFHKCNIFGSVDSKIKRQFTGEKNFAFERNAINARQLREGRPVAE